MDASLALAGIDLQWTTHSHAVWRDLAHDVAALHGGVRREFGTALTAMQLAFDDASPLGWIVVGPAGAGKTHLLSVLRREAFRNGAAFIFADMTDVRDFWGTTLLGFLESLRKADPSGVDQSAALVGGLVAAHLPKERDAAAQLGVARVNEVIGLARRLLGALARVEPTATQRFQDALRALVLMQSEDFDLANLGYGWLQGSDLTDAELRLAGFSQAPVGARETVRALSWLLGRGGPTVLALDQLDAFVTEHSVMARGAADDALGARQQASRSIIEGIGAGLAELRDVTRRTLVVVSCIEATWQVLKETALRSAMDRYEAPRTLGNLASADVAAALLAARLGPAYGKHGFSPPYPTWPFSPRVLAEAAHLSARELLKRCDAHRRRCLAEGAVVELEALGAEESPLRLAASTPAEGAQLDAELAQLLRTAPSADELDEEERMQALLVTAAHVVVSEADLPPHLSVSVDEAFPTRKRFAPLHARIRIVDSAALDREVHVCLRAIAHDNPVAYQARLGAALTAAGIDRNLPFRHLLVIRESPPPGGRKCVELTSALRAAAGAFASLAPLERQTLWAVEQLRARRAGEAAFEAWLRARRPVSSLSAFKRLAAWVQGGVVHGAASAPAARASALSPTPAAARVARSIGQGVLDAGAGSALGAASPGAFVSLGRQLEGDRLTELCGVSLRTLAAHVAVLAGSGAGKTVLLRRLIEELALAGVPSIVVDGSGDLTRLGQRWPSPPPSLSVEERRRAVRYHGTSEVVVWTPGQAAGHDLPLAPAPDGTPLDPRMLLNASPSGRTRVSVLSLVGLPTLGARQQAVHHLAAALATWLAEAQPALAHGLRGVLVIDEAKDFLPVLGRPPCHVSLERLMNEGREHGFGVILATQAPRRIDPAVVEACATQIFGRTSSPAAITVVMEFLRKRGGEGADVARLAPGHFYLHSADRSSPARLRAPLCLSWHAAAPPDEAAILAAAAASRASSGTA